MSLSWHLRLLLYQSVLAGTTLRIHHARGIAAGLAPVCPPFFSDQRMTLVGRDIGIGSPEALERVAALYSDVVRMDGPTPERSAPIWCC